jgi:hypothetical protein
MIPLVVAGIAGAWVMGRTKPKTKMRSLAMFGPRTGTTYTVEVLPGETAIVVHDPKGSVCLLKKNPGAGYALLHPLQGTREGILALLTDFQS